MYNGADQSWRNLPRFMSLDTASDALNDIFDYSVGAGLKSVGIIFHGGEPTLFPVADFEALIQLIHERLDDRGIESRLSIQTNLTVHRPETRALLLKHEVAFGVSMDLTQEAHDRQRVDLRGNPTYDRVVAGLHELRQETNGEQPRGMLMVIDPVVDPVDAFDFIESQGVGFVDLLLPDQTWDTADEVRLAEVFGPWLQKLFELYRTRERHFSIRWFQTALKLSAGGLWGSDMLGLRSAGTLIVDTDGSFDLHDVLRMASEEVNDTAVRAGDGDLQAIENLEGMQAMMDKEAHLAAECRECPVKAVCGGGHIAHRYSDAKGLNNRSVYCGALRPLYDDIRLAVSNAR